MTGSMKNLLDHLDFFTLTVSPRKEMFRKKAFILTTATGSTAAVGQIKKYLKSWGINRVSSIVANIQMTVCQEKICKWLWKQDLLHLPDVINRRRAWLLWMMKRCCRKWKQLLIPQLPKLINYLKAGMKPGYRVKLNLMSAKGKEDFYEKFCFVVRPNDIFGAGMDQWICL